MPKLAIHGGTPVRTKPWPGWPVHDDTERAALNEVLESGRWGRLSGDKVAAFENAFAEYQHARYGIAVTSGTAALTVALKAAGIDVGDEVIVPAYTFIATATAVLQNNAIPIFVDVEPDTVNIDLKAVEAAITPRTRAVVPVHWLGRAVDMDGLTALARKHDLVIVEDACHGWGARWNGRGVGALGAFGGFSFQESKNITGGEGGIILTNDEELAGRAFSYHHIGRLAGRPFYEHALVGWNFRMTEFQAAILLSQLTRLEAQTELRERNAQLLDAHLRQVPGLSPLRREAYMTRISWHGYSLIYDARALGGLPREKWIQAMAAEGVPSGPGYPHPLYRNPVFQERAFGRIADYIPFPDYREANCPVSEALCRSDYIFMVQPMLLGTEEDMRDIVRAAEKVADNAAELRGTTAVSKPATVVLPNLRPMVSWDKGQNFQVNGYLQFQMECLGESRDYDYWFLAGVGGDAHTQVFTADTSKWCHSLSQIDFGPEFAKTLYDAVGYDYAYVTEEQFNADRPRHVGELVKCIDRGIPVVAKETGSSTRTKAQEFSLLVGYEDSGGQLLFVEGDSTKPYKVPTNQNVSYLFILPGAKKQAPPLADAYRRAVLNIPALLTRPQKGDISFGREAFDAWAKHLLAEDYAGWTDEQLDIWQLHTTYVCIVATNGSDIHFLDRAVRLCPDLPFIRDVYKEYGEMGRLWFKEMDATGGSFNITKQTLRNKEAKRPIADFIKRYAACCDRILEIYRANGYGPGASPKGKPVARAQ